MRQRERKKIAATFHGAGMVVPYDKTQVREPLCRCFISLFSRLVSLSTVGRLATERYPRQPPLSRESSGTLWRLRETRREIKLSMFYKSWSQMYRYRSPGLIQSVLISHILIS